MQQTQHAAISCTEEYAMSSLKPVTTVLEELGALECMRWLIHMKEQNGTPVGIEDQTVLQSRTDSVHSRLLAGETTGDPALDFVLVTEGAKAEKALDRERVKLLNFLLKLHTQDKFMMQHSMHVKIEPFNIGVCTRQETLSVWRLRGISIKRANNPAGWKINADTYGKSVHYTVTDVGWTHARAEILEAADVTLSLDSVCEYLCGQRVEAKSSDHGWSYMRLDVDGEAALRLLEENRFVHPAGDHFNNAIVKAIRMIKE